VPCATDGSNPRLDRPTSLTEKSTTCPTNRRPKNAYSRGQVGTQGARPGTAVGKSSSGAGPPNPEGEGPAIWESGRARENDCGCGSSGVVRARATHAQPPPQKRSFVGSEAGPKHLSENGSPTVPAAPSQGLLAELIACSKQSAIELRPDQLKVVRDYELPLSQYEHILIESPTGSGKTVIAAEIIKRAKANYKRVLFLAHRREIIIQTSERLTKHGIPLGGYGIILSGCDEFLRPQALIQIASIDTLHARSKRRAINLPPARGTEVGLAAIVHSQRMSRDNPSVSSVVEPRKSTGDDTGPTGWAEKAKGQLVLGAPPLSQVPRDRRRPIPLEERVNLSLFPRNRNGNVKFMQLEGD
jgi:hypothetical protein